MSYNSNLEPRAIQRPRNSSISFENSHTLGRSFVYSSFKPELSQNLNNTPAIHSPNDIHEQTADLADVGVTNVDDDTGDDPSMLFYEPIGIWFKQQSASRITIAFVTETATTIILLHERP
ncbi:unnamed protein product [Ambrosiozyma monospora]|uniref:Unnamed protein product n=1 Tax=Ambrosiozyma monospora TaxID=43982 RepID=A0A9W7DL35_AMBMO|nr:unnamed protein product [Ambrosiozyma monospora]